MKAVAVGILTLLGLDIHVKDKDIREVDNSYDGMIDKRYDININGKQMYFDGNKCALEITYYYDGVDEPEFWLAIEVYSEKTVVLNKMKAEFIDKQHIMSISDKFIGRIKPHISFN